MKVAITLEGSSRREYARKNKESLKVTNKTLEGGRLKSPLWRKSPSLQNGTGCGRSQFWNGKCTLW